MRLFHKVKYCLNSDPVSNSYPNERYYSTLRGAKIGKDTLIQIHSGLSKDKAALSGLAIDENTGEYLIKIESADINSSVYRL